MNRYYKLDENNNTVPCSIEECNFDIDGRRVAECYINDHHVSTVFLAVNHGYDDKTPLLFETMIFDEGSNSIYEERCATLQEAFEQHTEAVKWLINRFKVEE
jgi:hypothetical protein